MTFDEILPSLMDGWKIRSDSWPAHEYTFLEGGVIYSEDGIFWHDIPISWLFCTDWELYNDQTA